MWKDYFKFCVERNPFDKAISLYYWRTRDAAERPGLVEFLSMIDEPSLSNAHIYSDSENIQVDRVIRYERLGPELNEVGIKLGIGTLKLPRAKGGIRDNRAHYRDLLTSEARAIIERVCWREIELLGYRY